MWATVVLMAIVASAEPVRVGAVVFAISQQRPMRLLLTCYALGFGTNLAIGTLVVFVFRGTTLGAIGSFSGEVRIMVGLLVLAVGALAVARLRTVRASRPAVLRPWWVSCLIGVGTGLPTGEHLAAMATIVTSGGTPGDQIGALVVFNLAAFWVAETAIIGLVLAPESTGARVDQICQWMRDHRRFLVATLAGAIGAYFVATGVATV